MNRQDLNGSMDLGLSQQESMIAPGIEAMKKMQQKERAVANEQDSAQKPLLE